MSILIVNLLFLSILFCYAIVSNKNKQFYLFSPFCFPFINFAIYYLLPSTVNYFFKESKEIRIHHILYFLGILSFLSGVSLSKKIITTKEYDLTVRPGFIKAKNIPLWLFYSIGVALLTIYGIWSGVTDGLLSGRNIDGLRRSAEIGKGFIKEPGLYLTSISGLWLIGNYLNPVHRSLFGLKGIFVMLFASIFIFFTVGHKLASLLPLLVMTGLYNKYKPLSSIKMLAIGLFFFLLIGMINIVRVGEIKGPIGSILINKSIIVSYAYDFNYVPIVNSVYKGKIDLQYGREYLQDALLFVPRFLYANKPVSFDYFLKEMTHSTFKGGGLPPTTIGSLFLNFGFTGVIFGMLLIGFGYNYLFYLYLRATYAKAVILLFIMYYIMRPSQFFGHTIVFIVFIFVIALASHFMYEVALSRKERESGI
ncbi:MAG: hypothetical protein A2132_01745 [Nitrospirae bacterium RBG_16_43_11]|nr:MAG: hypothetical protein A2132_01745 [Nitrospirae bacterium RBG_16_43_11]